MSQPTFNFHATTDPAKKAELWQLFVRFTREAIVSGRTHFSARAVFHRIRWESVVVQMASDDYKINNNLSREFALRYMEENPQHQGFFRTRGK